MKKILIILICIVIIGCQFPVQKNNLAENVEEHELLGYWRADRHSYFLTTDILKNTKKRVNDSISLRLNKNMVFDFENAVYIENGEIRQKSFSGKWKLVKLDVNGKTLYLVVFEDTPNLPKYLRSGINVYENDATIQLISFMDDPDMGNRLLLKKSLYNG